MNFQNVIEIDASPDRVWQVMSDVERWPEWTASMTSIRWLDAGGMRLGNRAEVVQPGLPKAIYEVSRLAERGFDWTSRAPGVVSVGRHWIEPTARGSRATIRMDASGPLAGLAGLLLRRLGTRYLELENRGLKQRSEDGG